MQSLGRAVFFAEPVNIYGRIDPFFAETTLSAQVTRHFRSFEESGPDRMIIAIRFGSAGDANDILSFTLCAVLAVLHNHLIAASQLFRMIWTSTVVIYTR
jgi:hypothetical protein